MAAYNHVFPVYSQVLYPTELSAVMPVERPPAYLAFRRASDNRLDEVVISLNG